MKIRRKISASIPDNFRFIKENLGMSEISQDALSQRVDNGN